MQHYCGYIAKQVNKTTPKTTLLVTMNNSFGNNNPTEKHVKRNQ
ncbi:hypothetical protein GCHA_3104 [Paraglaciecola chathamensis S18K6]|uniref:Uncharacterized protein n=1 Tax=Paraglaciecola chathamensis S18K6 TaxID=1127672 RepID=A0AAV3V2C7_9ALTE|nr:hypothetical protein GCHA_3104 [Paraglaciecola chathamensis S18K6]